MSRFGGELNTIFDVTNPKRVGSSAKAVRQNQRVPARWWRMQSAALGLEHFGGLAGRRAHFGELAD